MKKSLNELQAAVQEHILKGTAEVVADLKPPPRGSPAQRLGVYTHAYASRLTEFLAHDYPKLKTYLGESRFRELALAYISAHPSETPNARWFANKLPEFLGVSALTRRKPEITELALLERALNDAFDAPDAAIVTIADLAKLDPESVASMSFVLSPSIRRFTVDTNVTSLWASLKCDEAPPAPFALAAPQDILVWRQGGKSRFRMLGGEEAMAISVAQEGTPFSAICEMIAAMEDADNAAVRAATYLRGWIEAEIIAEIRLAPPGA